MIAEIMSLKKEDLIGLALKNYAFGYQNTDFSEICQATVLSAGNECFLKGILGQVKVPYFSNPDLFFPRPPARYGSLIPRHSHRSIGFK